MSYNFRKYLDSPIELAGVVLMVASGGLAAAGVLDDWSAAIPLIAGALLWAGAKPTNIGRDGADVDWGDKP